MNFCFFCLIFLERNMTTSAKVNSLSLLSESYLADQKLVVYKLLQISIGYLWNYSHFA